MLKFSMSPKFFLLLLTLLLGASLEAETALAKITHQKFTWPVLFQAQVGGPVGLALDTSTFPTPNHNIGLGLYTGGTDHRTFGENGSEFIVHPRYRYYWMDWGWGPFAQSGIIWENRTFPGGFPVQAAENYFGADLGFGVGYVRPESINFEMRISAVQWQAGNYGAVLAFGAGLGLGWLF